MSGLLKTPKVARAVGLAPNQGRLAAVALDGVAVKQVLPLAVAVRFSVKSTLPGLPVPGALSINPVDGILPATKVTAADGVSKVLHAASGAR